MGDQQAIVGGVCKNHGMLPAELYSIMKIAVKLGDIKELEFLLHYNGPVKCFELPAKLIKEESLIGKLISRGYVFNVHGITMYSSDMAELLIDNTCQYLQICSGLGCNNFIFHGLVKRGMVDPSENDALFDATLKMLDSINDYATKLGVNCFLENGCFTKSFSIPFCEAPSEPFLHLKLAQTFAMGLVLDLGHAALSARWYGKKLDDFLLPYIQAPHAPGIIHLSDNLLENDDHLAIGEGAADLRTVRSAIEFWPDSLMTIENHPDRIHKSLDWLVGYSNDRYIKSDIDELCRSMGWKF